MKNLFKNLMLVAVAAMAFTACTETNDEVNAVVKKTIVTGVASFGDDTRSGFTGSEVTEDENGESVTVYKSAWDGGENILLFAENGLETSATINAEGKFTAEFEGELPEKFYMTVCSPAVAWSSMYNYTIPAVQTPRANSVDPNAHILQAQNVYVINGTADHFNMQHQVAYGKMTVNTPAEFVIDHVEIALNGVFSNYPRNLSYTIKADNVENNVFWFATEPITVSDFTVTAYDAEGKAYTKSVTIPEGRTLAFGYGRVGSFSVSELKEYKAPDTVMDSAKYYFDYNNYGGYDNWGYVVFEDEFLGTLVLNCTFDSGLYLDICEYTSGANALGVRFDVGYSYYNVVGGTPSSLNYNYYNTMTVDVVDGKYSISLDVKNDNDEILKATYVGDIEGLGYPDLRTQLETPNVNATAEGNVINISWDPVTGADYYYIFCNIGGLEPITTTETSVSIEAAYSTQYQFIIRAEANDSNPDYRTSQDKYFDVTTGKDPNAFAANIATDLYFNGDGDLVFVVDAYETFKVRLNSANRPNNTTILAGDYTGINSSTVAEGQFSVYQKIKGGYNEGWSSTKTASTMSVEYVDGQYLIIIDYVSSWGGSGEVGYKGVPTGWDQPVADTTPVIKLDTTSVELMRAGGSVDVNVTLKNITEPIVAESNNAQFTTLVNGNVVTISAPENNTGADIDGIVTISAGGVSAQVMVKQAAEDVVAEVTWSYFLDSSSSGVYGHIWNVSGNDLDGYPVSAQITMDSRNGYTTSSNFTAGTYNYHAQYADGNFGDGMWFTMRNIEFRGTSYSNYDVTGTLTVEVVDGRTKITADIYNYVNGYQTTKITTFVGYLN
ncbi:MAG: BACON domain-containing protein [Alistipes sp.]|nr:BACON domain-containing protein [Alistipes sp.]